MNHQFSANIVATDIVATNAKLWFLILALLVGVNDKRVNGEDEYFSHAFEALQLTDVYYSEGISIGDLNRDGANDVVHGPYWFEGPDFRQRHELYKPVAQPQNKYADNFFSWVYDFNSDGWNDVFVVGFPGTAAHVYQNPGATGHDSHWAKHEVFDWVSNESPQFKNIVGDERPELVCTREGYFGYATIDWKQPMKKWEFHQVSDQVAHKRYGHGLGCW